MLHKGTAYLAGLAASLVLAAMVPAAASAGSISGTVTDQDTHSGITGIEVCPQPSPYVFEADCTETGAGGTYTLGGLPAASYQLHFSAWSDSLNYVQEWYGGDQIYPGDLVSVGATESKTGIDAELEEGGVIKGVATDSTTLGPAGGVWVCVEALDSDFFGRCHRANATGEYETDDLPTGDYRIEFNGENEVNYLQRFYDEEGSFGEATHLPVNAGTTVTGIDAMLSPGAQILGAVTESGTGTPLSGVEVCLWRPNGPVPPEFVQGCTRTDGSGDYAIRSLPADTYDVVFSREGSAWTEDFFGELWWKGVDSAALATPLTIAPPETISGIDAQLVDHKPHYPDPDNGPGTGATVSPPPPVAGKTPRGCKKGFHRKLVKGKKRCVRKHRGRRPHNR
jgi:hypothetical protein